ncbi:ferritin-like domain-containing protein [Mariniblastus sp.]|nr:ferritin-like domain-containing protein [Mariniblastus sp.]
MEAGRKIDQPESLTKLDWILKLDPTRLWWSCWLAFVIVDRMNITQFAEQIVFATTLEDKLRAPGRLTYGSEARRSAEFSSVRCPSRPHGMQMQLEDASAIAPPSDHLLENEKSRGQLLHFLANHELLATELMALVLLKFPDAPIAFRRGVLVTLQEEQEHTRMYLRRMKECGVEFGAFPLSGQFWKIVEPMNCPMDFVSRLSLTFEQANLDYSKHFAKVFRRIGDDETAAVLQKIYEDEIGHVQHGLDWFRKWKEPHLSDWDAYQQSLEFPMSPQRARGPNIDFNREGRQRAGLDDSFIDSVEVFRQSRGKAATLRWFDPGAESELAGEQSAKEQALLAQLGRDLETVMVLMAKPDDILLVQSLPSQELRKHWVDAVLTVPEFQMYDKVEDLSQRRLHNFAPWAWTPASHQLVAMTKGQPSAWKPQHADLYRKSWAANRLKTWLIDEGDDACDSVRDDLAFGDMSTAGVAVFRTDEVSQALKELDAAGYSTALIKQDLATSGRGQRRLKSNESLTKADQQWIASALTHGPCVVEPYLDRVLDLSYLWRLDHGETDAKFLGWTRPIVTEGRRYAGARLGDLFSDCEVEVRKFLLADRCVRLRKLADWLQQYLVPELSSVGFEGPFGVDAIVYRDQDQQLRLKPMVELNPRMTMGHVALALERKLAPGVRAKFRILTRPEWDRFSKSERSAPVTFNQAKRWTSGFVRLSEVNPSTKLIPLVQVGR